VDISIIICTWNNSKRLALTLSAIRRCAIPNGLRWELVLVNNNCSDDTDAIVNKFIDDLPLVYVCEPRQGLSRARNRGIEAASGRLVMFTDDDVTPSLDWISSYWVAYKSKPSGYYFGGPIDCEYELLEVDVELLKVAPASVRGLNWGTCPKRLNSNEFFISANWACPKEILEKIGAFDVNKGLNPSSGRIKTGEDTDAMDRLKKINMIPWYIPEARITHFVPADKCTLKHIVSRTKAGAREFAKEIKQNKDWPTIFRIPRWVYKEIIVLLMKMALNVSRGRKIYREYIRLIFLVNAINMARLADE